MSTPEETVAPEATQNNPITSYEIFLDSLGGPASIDPEKDPPRKRKVKEIMAQTREPNPVIGKVR